MFDFFSPAPLSDVELGRKAATHFHNESTRYSGYDETLDTMLSKVAGGKSPIFFLEGLGLAVRTIEMTDSQVQQAMKALASTAQGQIPRKELFHRALSDRISNPTAGDYLAATPQIALETAGEIVEGAQAVGDAVLGTGKILLAIAPILIVAGIVFIGYARTRQAAGQ